MLCIPPNISRRSDVNSYLMKVPDALRRPKRGKFEPAKSEDGIVMVPLLWHEYVCGVRERLRPGGARLT